MESAMVEGGEWSSFNGVSIEEADFMAQLFPNNNSSLANDQLECPSSFLAIYSPDDTTTDSTSNLYSNSNSSYSGENYYLSDTHHQFFAANTEGGVSLPYDFCLTNTTDYSHDQYPDTNLQLMKPECEMQPEIAEQANIEDKSSDDSSETARKRTRVSDHKGKRNVRSKKNQRVTTGSDDEDNDDPAFNKQNSSCCSSEDGSAVVSLNGKTRASRGSATDPQSLYARKRRERINERLRILQNLVPNGTKVDISTMLEEAVHYVKFLQLQIKLLSSDEMWMYAPLAYNGMDIGLELLNKIDALK